MKGAKISTNFSTKISDRKIQQTHNTLKVQQICQKFQQNGNTAVNLFE